ncbi:MAG: DUF2254 domain-containing protein [Brevundimonas sp.]|uniref:DUF2254 domain-containing protein n=1 Tax=Brevundimonas sp. TaxID=1871086 RepID=UPI00260AE1A3|nr:DUF2254 domain-containing protein [Brevundimonas sp.]MDI6624607.1 DUF2254 domain-containing protein [Brevundimonas sp.]MDQ7813107.1 DUF2254 domain-containing protein [Brevundimonas sp.]
MNRWRYYWRVLRTQIWFRAGLYAAFGVAAALIAALAAPLVPKEVADRLGGESVEAILTILASSLLAVATFSLGAWVSAYTAVSQAASPRVATLVTSDESTQKALATFVGAFLYAVVAVTAIHARYYGAEGRAVLYLTSLAVVSLVAFRLLAWINRLSNLARLGHMIELVEERTAEWLKTHPPAPAGPPVPGEEFNAPATGYVQNIDLPSLQRLAGDKGGHVEILAPVGSFRRRGEALGRVSFAASDEQTRESLRSAFSIARSRTFDQDPRFGLIVLGEIAARALSPGVNDPGTAAEVAGVAVRLLDNWGRRAPEEADVNRENDRVIRPVLDPEDLVQDVFGPLVRYGMGDLTVAVRVQKGLRSLAACDSAVSGAARRLAVETAQRARESLHKADRARFDAEFGKRARR